MSKQSYNIKVVQNLEDFRSLKDTWNSLAKSSKSYTPWLSWDWFNLCLKYFSSSKDELFVLLLHKADEIVAIAPFVMKSQRFRGTVQTRGLELLGCPHSPIRNFVFRDSREEDKANSMLNIFRYIRDEYRNWDVIELGRIPEENNVFGMFNRVISQVGLKFRTCFSAANWYLDGINYSFSQYFENLPKKIQKDVQYCRRRLEKMGSVRLEIESDGGSLDHYLDLYDKVREKSWKAAEKDKLFIREFTKLSAEEGWMRLAFLRYNDVPIACQKWIVCDQTGYIWDVLHDEDYGKHSPGKILSTEISQYAIDHDKVTEIDFMTGDEPYKRDWTPKRRERKDITIFNTTVKGQFLAFLAGALLPIIEKNRPLLFFKNKTLRYLKKHQRD